MNRILVWFSCGAASAYATYLAFGELENVEAVYCRVDDEHSDNKRFLLEFTEKTGIPITVIGDNKYSYRIENVFKARKFIKNRYGAICTSVLKRWQRELYQRPTDVHILGYTFEERGRVNNFIDNNDLLTDFILYRKRITKNNCFDFIKRIGIEMPTMYKLGYKNNNNCIGCVKGGMGYFNKIRKDFPYIFEKRARLERFIGHSINKDKNGPVFLDDLDPNRGIFKNDQPANCGFVCDKDG